MQNGNVREYQSKTQSLSEQIIAQFITLILQKNYHFIQLSSDIYFMDYLPVHLDPFYFIIYPFDSFEYLSLIETLKYYYTEFQSRLDNFFN